MPYQTPSLDQMWADLLLILGIALAAGGLVSLALCALGGCLELVERRRARRIRLRNQDLPQPIVRSEGARIVLVQSKQNSESVLSSERSYERQEETSHHRRWRPRRSNGSYSSSSSRI